jgi:GNAT superfamily N-acetyltransferase
MSATEVNVRVATAADAAMLARLRWELRASFHNVVENEAEFIERCTLWMTQRLGGDGPWQCWIAELKVAELSATPIGSVWVQLIEKIPNPIAEPEHYVYLTNFFVREEHRGKGIGSKLLAEALAWGRSKNAEVVILWPTERSKPLYLRHGFEPADDFMELVL